MGVKSYSMLANPTAGTTGTPLDRLVDIINTDLGLAGNNTGADIAGGAAAANTLNQMIVQAAAAVGAVSGTDKVFTAADVIAMNQWLRANYADAWATAHGNDSVDMETGFHLVQTDGASTKYRGLSAVDQVAEGIFNLGFEIVDGHFLNEDGNENASVDDVASWLTQFWTDHSTTGTGLDKIADIIMADSGLPKKISEADITGGVDAANGINGLIKQGIAATGVGNDGWISTADVVAINAWIRADMGRYNQFVALHGDDEMGYETGFHLVQNDGAATTMFCENFVNTVADGIYHIGFQILNGRFRNEDGDANAEVEDVANWINYFYADQSTTGTGLDRIVDAIKADRGLAKYTDAGEINEGAAAANGMNKIIVKAITTTNAMADGWITAEDLVAMNTYIKNKWLSEFTLFHGDDENGESTGFHLVQNNGGSSTLFNENLINTVADGIYHIGFDIEDGRFVNEDGDANATLDDVATWLNYFYGQKTVTLGGNGSDTITGKVLGEEIDAGDGNDTIYAAGGNDLILGGWGCDTVYGGAGDDLIYGGFDDDKLDGGDGSDLYKVSGSYDEGWCSFQGFDTYADTGTTGTDTIVATGGAVDIGMAKFGADNGIEVIDASGATSARILGDWKSNVLDFRTTSFIGNVIIDGGDGDDTIYGTAAGATMIGGRGNDKLNGVGGSDKYIVTGNEEDGWCSFQGFDTYGDTGASGTDRIVAKGEGNVDIGLTKFDAASGIEEIDGSGAAGTVRLLGDWKSNVLDFRSTTFLSSNIVIDGGDGDDTIFGTQAGAMIVGGRGNDKLNGVGGSDKYIVTGNEEGGWESFQGYDTYGDTGTNGTDKICAVGDGDVDIGLAKFDANSGIEVVDGSGAAGTVRLLGDWKSNTLDFRTTTFVGGNVVIDGGDGDDTIFGTAAAAVIVGGRGNDKLNGVGGGDKYIVTGNEEGGWESFSGFDTYGDTGTNGTDKICAVGDGDVDIGLAKFDVKSGIEVVDGTGAAGIVRLLGDWKSNTLDFRTVTFVGTNVVIDGGDGDDTIFGTTAGATLIGGRGNDKLNGVGGSDKYIVTGNEEGGWESFQGYDTYGDTGTSGTDTICAVGDGDVDIGLTKFDAKSGIEAVDGSLAAGTVRLLGDWKANVLDFRTVTFLSSNIVIDGGDGNDTIFGTAAAAVIIGGRGDDKLNGVGGSDTYIVTGNEEGGWESFQGYDTYGDTGTSGIDTIKAIGEENVDIGLTKFDAKSGIEAVDGSEAWGTVRLLGNWKANVLDFRGVTFLSDNIVIDGGDGDDKIWGTSGDDTIAGSWGNDTLTGGDGFDEFLMDCELSTWGNVDTITDFVVGEDVISLSTAVFEAFDGWAFVEEEAFTIGTNATTAEHRLIYNSATGALFYDADGVGGAEKVQVAKLTAGLALGADSFTIAGEIIIA